MAICQVLRFSVTLDASCAVERVQMQVPLDNRPTGHDPSSSVVGM